jgi:predicted phosphodiesterase
MKTLILPDIHGRGVWQYIVQKENADRVIFLGDYFDSFHIPGLDQIHNFKQIIEFKETSFTDEGTDNQHKTDVILLIGNHDYHYFPEIGYTGTSGYQGGIAPNITRIVDENRQHLQMAYKMDNLLFTHAGVSSLFMDQVFGENGWNIDNVDEELNELFEYRPRTFEFNEYDRSGYGDHIAQTPIWIRPIALLKANRESELKKKYIQIVGHTNTKHIDFAGKSTGGRYYFVDTLDNIQPEYLTIVDGEIHMNYI